MKKIMKVLLVTIMLLIMNTVNKNKVLAEELTTSFSGYYWDRVSEDGHEWSGSFRYYYLDGVDSYCLDPYTHEGGPLFESDWNATNISDALKGRILLIAHYGYNYPNHQTLEYRAATQAMIWETVTGHTVRFFTGRAGTGTELDISNEREEVERLMAEHYVKPSFDDKTYTAQVGQQLILEDTNNILSNYRVSVEGVDFDLQNNQLAIVPRRNGEIDISLTRESHYISNYKIFISDIYQNQIVPGNVDIEASHVKINTYYGNLKLTKKDSEIGTAQGSATLEGAKYGVYRQDNDELVATLITDISGNAETGNILPYGDYYVKEFLNPIGYQIDETVYYFSLKGKESIHLDLFENVIKGKIKITKLDLENNSCTSQGQASLIGAKYQILDSQNNIVDTLIIGSDCMAVSKDLPYGNYKVKEIESPIGYSIDNNVYDVSVNSNNVILEVISKEEVIKGKIKITKLDSENNSCTSQGQASLVGAKYQVLDSQNNIVDTLIIGSDCMAVSKDLPYGNYKVKEIESPTGYNIDNNVYTIDINNHSQIVEVVSKEEVIKNYISILKQYDFVDETTQFLNAEANIKFEIYYPDNTLYDTIITDKNGYATIEIPYGVWKFHQVNTNAGFERIYDFYITIDENSEKQQYYNILNNKLSAYLQVFKADSETGKIIAISNTAFKILNIDTKEYVSQYVAGKVLDTFYTDETGKMVTYLKLESGNYKLVEVSSPNGYLKDEDGIKFNIGEDTHYSYTTYGAFITVTYENKPIKGQIEVNKTGEVFVVKNSNYFYDIKKLSGVEFKIYAAGDILSSDGNYLYYHNGELVDTIITNENGYAISKELPLGKYYIKESKTVDGYVLDNTIHYFTLTEVDNKTEIVYESLSKVNYLKKGTLEFTKTDLVNGDVIPDTMVEIYTDKDELIFTGKTAQNGKIVITDLKAGKYYILEKEPSTGYMITTEKVYFEIKENGEIVKAEMKNEPITGILEFTKIDLSTGSPLPNTLIEIYSDNDELIFSDRTNDNGQVIINNLKYGKYYILEKEAPEGYQLNKNKMFFEIKEDGEVVRATMADEIIVFEVPNTYSECTNFIIIIQICISFIAIGFIMYDKKS